MASTSRIDPVAALRTILNDEGDSDSDASMDSMASEQSGDDTLLVPSSDNISDTSDDDISSTSDGEESDELSSTDDEPVAPPPKRPAQRGRGQAGRGRARGRRGRAPSQPGQPLPALGDVWRKDAPPVGRQRHANVVRERASQRNLGGAAEALQLFKLFITTAMMNVIALRTNEEGLRECGVAWKDVAVMEISSAIGLILFLGLTKSGRENI